MSDSAGGTPPTPAREDVPLRPNFLLVETFPNPTPWNIAPPTATTCLVITEIGETLGRRLLFPQIQHPTEFQSPVGMETEHRETGAGGQGRAGEQACSQRPVWVPGTARPDEAARQPDLRRLSQCRGTANKSIFTLHRVSQCKCGKDKKHFRMSRQ